MKNGIVKQNIKWNILINHNTDFNVVKRKNYTLA